MCLFYLYNCMYICICAYFCHYSILLANTILFFDGRKNMSTSLQHCSFSRAYGDGPFTFQREGPQALFDAHKSISWLPIKAAVGPCFWYLSHHKQWHNAGSKSKRAVLTCTKSIQINSIRRLQQCVDTLTYVGRPTVNLDWCQPVNPLPLMNQSW